MTQTMDATETAATETTAPVEPPVEDAVDEAEAAAERAEAAAREADASADRAEAAEAERTAAASARAKKAAATRAEAERRYAYGGPGGFWLPGAGRVVHAGETVPGALLDGLGARARARFAPVDDDVEG